MLPRPRKQPWIKIFWCPQCTRKFWQRPEIWLGICQNCDYKNQDGRRELV